MATKNPFGKIRKESDPYVTLEMDGWTWKVLKLYQTPAGSLTNPFARAFCLVSSPFYPGGELGDVYVKEIPGLLAWLANHAKEIA